MEAVAQRRLVGAFRCHAAALAGEPVRFTDKIEIAGETGCVHGVVGEVRGQGDVDKRAHDDVDLVERGFIKLSPAYNPGVFFEIREIAVDVRAVGPGTGLPRGNNDVGAAG